MSEDAYLSALSSNTSPAVEAAPLKGIVGERLAVADEVAEGFFVGTFFRFMP